MVGRLAGGECDVEEEGPVRVCGHQLSEPLAGLIDDVFGQVIALTLRRFDPLVPGDQLRVPLVRLARHKAVDHLRHPAHADAVMVAADEQAGPGRRAERGGLKVRVAQPIGRQTVEGRCFDVGAVAAEFGVAT